MTPPAARQVAVLADLCDACQHPKHWHLGRRCAGDFLSCECRSPTDPVTNNRRSEA